MEPPILTVGELIAVLQRYDPTTEVVVTWEGVYRRLILQGMEPVPFGFQVDRPMLVFDAEHASV